MSLQKYILVESDQKGKVPIYGNIREWLQKFYGILVEYKIGEGQEGIAYKIKDKDLVVKVILDMSYMYVDGNKLKEISNKNFEYLNPINYYQLDGDDNLLFYISPNLEEKEIIDDIKDSMRYHIDFFSDLMMYIKNANNYEDGIKELIDEYKSEERAGDDFNLNNYVPEVEKELIKYLRECYMASEEAISNNLKLDPVDENMLYDKKENKYKLIDYL